MSNSDWEFSPPEDNNINGELLNQIDEKIKISNSLKSFTSMLVVNNGFLVYEKYYNGTNELTKHKIYSITKAVISALIGIAIDQDILKIDDKVIDIFSNQNFSHVDKDKHAITIKHLLTMTSGLDWKEDWSTGDIPQIYYDLQNSPDPLHFILNRPMSHPPGTILNYIQANAHLLSLVLQKISNTSTLLFAQSNLFDLLGIQSMDYKWKTDKQGVVLGNIGLEMTSRQLAKFGQLYLNKGQWNSKQVISGSWIEESTTAHIENLGYLWNISPSIGGYFARGYNFQFLFILPDNDLLIVFTSNGSDPSPLLNLMIDELIV